MQKKFLAVAAFVFAAAFAITASANMMASDFGSSTLKKGSSGTSVVNLQTALNTCNAAGLTADGVFGRGTEAAVKAFQASKALTADGLAGTNTKVALANCGSSTPATPATGLCPNGMTLASNCSATPAGTPSQALCPNGMTLASNCAAPAAGSVVSGTSGSLTNVNSISGFSGLTLTAGQTSQKVLGAQFTATGADMKIDRLIVDFKRNSTTGYYQISQYINSVDIWNDTTKLASLPVGSASDITTTSPDTYEFNIGGLNYVVPVGTTGHLYVAVNVNTSIDNGYASGNTWTVTVPANGLRAIEPSGQSSTYPGATTLASSTFTVNNLSSSGNVQLRASVNANNPLAYGQQVNSTTGSTDNVKLLSIDMYAKPGSDLTVRKFPVKVTVAGSASAVDAVINNLKLSNGTNSYTANVSGACSAGTSCTVLFGADSGVLGWNIPAGTTQTWTVSASIKPIAGSFAEGDSVVASVDTLYPTALANGLDVQDSIGNPINTAGALTGGATGNSVGFYVNGITVSAASQTATISQQAQSQTHQNGNFTLSFTVNALNSSIYIPKAVSNASPSTGGYVYYTLKNGSTAVGSAALTSSISSTTILSSDTSTDFFVSAGSSRTFTVNVGLNNNTVAAGAFQSGSFVLSLTGVNNSQVSGSGYADYTLNINNIYTNPPLNLY